MTGTLDEQNVYNGELDHQTKKPISTQDHTAQDMISEPEVKRQKIEDDTQGLEASQSNKSDTNSSASHSSDEIEMHIVDIEQFSGSATPDSIEVDEGNEYPNILDWNNIEKIKDLFSPNDKYGNNPISELIEDQDLDGLNTKLQSVMKNSGASYSNADLLKEIAHLVCDTHICSIDVTKMTYFAASTQLDVLGELDDNTVLLGSSITSSHD